ncbi:MAG: KEOPS complex subunit Cgi121 [Methanobacterium sp.]|nr:KEOPS complex subunit Cgi121 [Methanobacterium sp.]
MENNIQILGFSSQVDDITDLMSKLDEISEKNSQDCIIQLLNANGIAGEQHIHHAIIHAQNAFKRNDNIARDLGLEICVRASAQRQIYKALDILGLKKGYNNICAVIVNCNKDLSSQLELILSKRDDEILKADKTILKDIYQISDNEINTAGGVSWAMMERTSLLILEN